MAQVCLKDLPMVSIRGFLLTSSLASKGYYDHAQIRKPPLVAPPTLFFYQEKKEYKSYMYLSLATSQEFYLYYFLFGII